MKKGKRREKKKSKKKTKQKTKGGQIGKKKMEREK